MDEPVEAFPSLVIDISDDNSVFDSGAEYTSSENVDNENEEALKATTRSLGLSKFYIPDWTRKDAFRELYQNWRDAILESFDLNPRQLIPEWQDAGNEIRITLRRQHAEATERELLGYIRFKKKQGSLELANFRAQLTPQNLHLGVSSKRGNEIAAGCHGEGFKLAALVLCRHNHGVRFVSSSYYWSFGFRGRHKSNFYCSLRPIKPEKLQKYQAKYSENASKGLPRGLKTNDWEDVSVTISKARGELGQKIETEEFISWTTIILDLKGPSPTDIVQTSTGDLILDKSFSGKVYLKGLLLCDTSSGSDPFVYGYNFLRGNVDRDRRSMKDSSKKGAIIIGIWERAVQKRGDDFIALFVNLLQDHPTSADVRFAQDKITSATARAIWQHLVSVRNGGFYYREKQGNKDFELIHRCLKKRPLPLSEPLWNILSQFCLVKTPDEQRAYLFRISQPSNAKTTMFSENVHRGLTASLALSPRTRDIKISYVQSSDTGIDLLFSAEESLLWIHDKWLDFQRIHETASCQVSKLANGPNSFSKGFACDHIVEELYELVLAEITRTFDLVRDEAVTFSRSLRHKARDMLRQMPRKIEVLENANPRELEVSWVDCDSSLLSHLYGINMRYLVALHRNSTCIDERQKLLGDYGIPQQTDSGYPAIIAPCGCPSRVVSTRLNKTVFKNLNLTEEYFPMVASVGIGSFFGQPPKAIKPRHQPLVSPRAANTVFAVSAPGRQNSGTSNRYGFQPVNGEAGNTDLDNHLPSPQLDRNVLAAGKVCLPGQPGDINSERAKTIDASELKALENDKIWKTWHVERLPKIFSNFTSTRDAQTANESSISSLLCPHLEYTFKAGEYSRIRQKPVKDGDETIEYIVLVHGFDWEEQADGKDYRLLVSKYSFLITAKFFDTRVEKTSAARTTNKELLLHFQDFETMGEKQDAEVIHISEIISAQDLETNSRSAMDAVEHVISVPQDVSTYNFFCRFAIRSCPDPGIACLTPLGSNLVRHRNRWKLPSYQYPCSPAVYDMSPSVLGPAEGFMQASCDIYAAFDFDPSRNATWKARYHAASVYDGSPASVLADITQCQLPRPNFPAPSVPKIALIAGSVNPFDLIDPRYQALEKLNLSRHLGTLTAVAASSPSAFDFIVMLMPSSILHELMYPSFFDSVFTLLMKRYCVHLKLIHPPDYGVPQAREAIVLIASPVCAASPWGGKKESLTTIRELIHDLAFANTRVSGQITGFVCKGKHSSASPPIYNHQTGVKSYFRPIDLDATAEEVSAYHVPRLSHPDRGDRLTTRELARLQGFPDDFIFLQSKQDQFINVLTAFPPPIAKMVAETVLRIARKYQTVPVDLLGNLGSRGTKRTRAEVDDP